jgi:hypothetical protein
MSGIVLKMDFAFPRLINTATSARLPKHRTITPAVSTAKMTSMKLLKRLNYREGSPATG